jgi:hypothetical protein
MWRWGSQPSFFAGNGVPYEFTSSDASGPVDIISKPNSQAIIMGPIGPQRPFKNDYDGQQCAGDV